MTDIIIQREISTKDFTLGTIEFMDFKGKTVEDAIRARKIPKITCIPEGRYITSLYKSPRLHREVILLHGVPNFSFIEIHPGNWATDLEGCIAPGLRYMTDMTGVAESKRAMDMIMELYKQELKKRSIYVNIMNPLQIWEGWDK